MKWALYHDEKWSQKPFVGAGDPPGREIEASKFLAKTINRCSTKGHIYSLVKLWTTYYPCHLITVMVHGRLRFVWQFWTSMMTSSCSIWGLFRPTLIRGLFGIKMFQSRKSLYFDLGRLAACWSRCYNDEEGEKKDNNIEGESLGHRDSIGRRG